MPPPSPISTVGQSPVSSHPISPLPRLVVLISGSGTNLQAILDAIQSGELQAQVALVVSNRAQAYGLQRAQAAGVPTRYFPLKPYTQTGRPREAYAADLAAAVARAQPDLVVLAGWMHILSAAFLNRFPNRVINLHPALPGAFPGAHAIEDAFAAWRAGQVTASGCMVHFAVPEVDAGPVIAQAVVPFQPGDTLDAFAARLHAAERRLIVEAIRRVVTG